MASNYPSLEQRVQKSGDYVGRRRRRVAIDPAENPYDLPLDAINVANPELFKHDAFGRYFKRLRDEAPVHYCAESQYGPYWSITRYKDIIEIDRRHSEFSSDHQFGGVTIMGTPGSANEIPMFIQMDPPKHDQQRLSVAPRFTQRSLGELADTIRSRAIRIIDNLPRNETFDWVEHVSVELTSQMLATLFDVPQSDRHQLIQWSNIVSNADNPEYVDRAATFYQALIDCGEYFQALWNERVRNPGNDLISMLAHGESTRDMEARELLGNVVLLLVGGNDTTRNSISGGLLALNQFPDEYAKLRAAPDLVESMVPEIIRWQTPLTHMRRTASCDVSFRGQRIRAGDAVIMWYISGNRDERVIDDPDRFIIDRKRPREHLSFGFGIHRCLGNRLAEMQLRILWEELLARTQQIEIVGSPVRVSSCLFRAIQKMPVRISA